jgi:hypothetical protein
MYGYGRDARPEWLGHGERCGTPVRAAEEEPAGVRGGDNLGKAGGIRESLFAEIAQSLVEHGVRLESFGSELGWEKHARTSGLGPVDRGGYGVADLIGAAEIAAEKDGGDAVLDRVFAELERDELLDFALLPLSPAFAGAGRARPCSQVSHHWTR